VIFDGSLIQQMGARCASDGLITNRCLRFLAINFMLTIVRRVRQTGSRVHGVLVIAICWPSTSSITSINGAGESSAHFPLASPTRAL
jgi:hypothetical protein